MSTNDSKVEEQVAEYLRQAATPPADREHELEGHLVRVRGDAAVFYVEHGAARPLGHRGLLELFDEAPQEIEREALAGLHVGMPLTVLHERSGRMFILLGGKKRPVLMGLPTAVVDDGVLGGVPLDSRPIHWYPGSGPGLAGRR